MSHSLILRHAHVGKIRESIEPLNQKKGGTGFHTKKQTCFNYGTTGHIACNCPNWAFVPFYAHRSENETR